MKILRTEIINGLFTVDIDGVLERVRIGDTVFDDVENAYRLDSVAIYNFYTLKRSTLVLTKLEGEKPIGKYLLDTRLSKQQWLELMENFMWDETESQTKNVPFAVAM